MLSAGVWDPKNNRWQAAGRASYGHGYPSTALLLPDGRVVAAGPEKTMELCHPCYTFVDHRSVIADVPERIAWYSFAQAV